jgi:hypothetical protein
MTVVAAYMPRTWQEGLFLLVCGPILAWLLLHFMGWVMPGSTTLHMPPEEIHHTLFALHRLGGTRLVWDALPVGDGRLEIDGLRPLEIDGLHLEDTTGKPVHVGWERYEDDAYALANRYSNVPGHYVLALPSGTVISGEAGWV